MNEIIIYKNLLPKEKTYVNFIFTERKEHSLSCLLVDYRINAIMPLNQLTRKKKIKSLNKLTPLNKHLIGWIEEINSTDIIISLAFVDKDCDLYKNFIKENSKNDALKTLITRYSYKNNLNLSNFWSKVFNSIELDKLQTSLYDYFFENLDSLNLDNDFKTFAKDLLNKNNKKNYLTTDFKLVSNIGLNELKNILTSILKECNLDCDIKLDNCPNYKLISNNSEIKKEEHNIFINRIKNYYGLFLF